MLRICGLPSAGIGRSVSTETSGRRGRWEACEVETPNAISYAEQQLVLTKLQGGSGASAPVLAGDWHLS